MPTTSKNLLRLAITLVALFSAAHLTADLTFAPGNYYTSDYSSRTITQYNNTGAVIGTLTLPSALGDGIQGLAFGADNLLYATVLRGSNGFAVLALDGSGGVQQTYAAPVYTAGNLSYGKIALDGQYLYVTGQNQLTRFLLGDPNSGTSIYTNNQVFDVKPLPSGNLFVASAYTIDEITKSGMVVRSISLQGGEYFTDIRGIEYNPTTNDLFVTHLGHSNFFFQIMRLDATTGLLEKNVTMNYADDMYLTSSGQLLVGSRTQVPRFYDQDLNQTGALGGGQQMFVTQYPIPEPAVIAYVCVGALALALQAHRRNRRERQDSGAR